jgi:CubicO group peptidase (beta-lactamase class C family)
MKIRLCLFALMLVIRAGADEDPLPATLMTLPGELLASEDFDQALAPFTGVPEGFASGFRGWRFNHLPKAGHWEQKNGVFTGTELPGSHHPATASFGLGFQDAIIQCEVRLDNVPSEGRPYRTAFLKITDRKDYVVQLSIGSGGLFLTPYDATRIDPKTGQRERGTPAKARFPVALDEWHTLVLEISGDEIVGTLDGRSVTLSNALFGADKHSLMIGAGTQASFRHFRVWKTRPNPGWTASKEKLLADQAPGVHDLFAADKLAALDEEITRSIANGRIMGAAVWVEREGVSHHRAFGDRAVTPTVEPMSEDTLFDAASITKVVATASAAMRCVELGLIGLEDPVSKHLPEFTGEGREKITVRHLLLHAGGLPVNLNGSGAPYSRTPAEAYARACQEKLLFEPGSAFSYSSVGSMVLGMVIERASGRTFDEFCTTELFEPLKMRDTLFLPSGAILERVAPSSAPRRGVPDDTVAREMGGVSGHASLFTTTSDLARFARMMLNQGELEGVRLFKPETIRLMTSVQSPPGLRSPDAKNLPVRRGLGWDIDTPYRTAPHPYSLARGALFPVGSYGHTGWTGQMLWIDPYSKTFVIFLCNRYVPDGKDTRSAVSQLHHRLSTLAAEAVKGFDFQNVPGALPRSTDDP